MKKLMLGLFMLSLTCGVFAAQFNVKECSKLLQNKQYAEAVEYVKTNNECLTFEQKRIYCLFALTEQAFITKTLTENTFVSAIDAQIAKMNFSEDEKLIVKLFIFSNSSALNMKSINLVKQFENFYAANEIKIKQLLTNKEYAKSIVFCLCKYSLAAKKYDRAFEFSLKSNAKTINNYKFIVVKSLNSNDKIVELCNVIIANPTEIINTANQLNQCIDLTKRLNDAKYDNVVKPLYTKLKRVFYQNLTKGDDWKAALTNLQLQMNAYGM